MKGFRTTFYSPGKPGPLWGQNPGPVSFSLNCVVCEGLTTVCLHPPLLHFSPGSSFSYSFPTVKDDGFSAPHNLLLIPEAKGIQELRNFHANSKHGSELKTNKDFKDKVKYKN